MYNQPKSPPGTSNIRIIRKPAKTKSVFDDDGEPMPVGPGGRLSLIGQGAT